MLDEEDLAEVVRRERQLLEPRLRAAPDRVQELLHPDFLEHGASGRIWDRDTMIAALSADPGLPGEGADFVPVRLANDVVLLTYRIVGSSGSLRSSVWVNVPPAGWVLRFHQGTRALPHE